MLAKLEKFKATMSSKSVGADGESGGHKDEDLSDWTKVKLKFEPQSGKVFSFLFISLPPLSLSDS